VAATERLKAEQAMAAARLAEATAQSSKETTKTVGAATVGAGNSFSKVLYMVQRQLLIGGHGLFFKLKIGNCEQSCVELEFQFTRDCSKRIDYTGPLPKSGGQTIRYRQISAGSP
jgi:hypothetical protein